MHCTEPHVSIIASTQLDHVTIHEWLHRVGVAEEYSLERGTPAATLAELAGRRCYNSFEIGLNPNITKIRQDLCAYIENILASKHGSVLEHASYSFAIEGVSRVFTAEMNRHRAGWAISEGSLRYIRFDDIPYWFPHSLSGTDTQATRAKEIFARAFSQMEENYHELCEIYNIEQETSFVRKKHLTSAFRRIIGMGVATGGIWTGNVRAIRHVLATRVQPAAEEEIAYVMGKVLVLLKTREPEIFQDFTYNEDTWNITHWKV